MKVKHKRHKGAVRQKNGCIWEKVPKGGGSTKIPSRGEDLHLKCNAGYRDLIQAPPVSYPISPRLFTCGDTNHSDCAKLT